MTICRQCVIRIAGASGRGTVTSDSPNTPERDTSDSRAPSVETNSVVPEKLIPDPRLTAAPRRMIWSARD